MNVLHHGLLWNKIRRGDFAGVNLGEMVIARDRRPGNVSLSDIHAGGTGEASSVYYTEQTSEDRRFFARSIDPEMRAAVECVQDGIFLLPEIEHTDEAIGHLARSAKKFRDRREELISPLPADPTWIEYDQKFDDGGAPTRVGALAFDVKPGRSDSLRRVMAVFFGYGKISIGPIGLFLTGLEDERMFHWIALLGKYEEAFEIIDKTPTQVYRSLQGAVVRSSDKLDILMNMTSCKNAAIEPVRIKGKRRKRWAREPRGIVCKTVVLRDKKGKVFYDTASAALEPTKMPLHSIMRHEKTYTKERPLFGKHVGTFLWQPQMRGDAKNGIIEKDYKVEN